MILTDITEGWTQELGPFTLLVDGAALDLTGFTVEAELRNDIGTAITSGSVRVASSQSTTGKGQVYYTPSAADLVWRIGGREFTPYSLRWKVTDGGGAVVFFPNGARDIIRVFQV